jgi:hypothetical protein
LPGFGSLPQSVAGRFRAVKLVSSLTRGSDTGDRHPER